MKRLYIILIAVLLCAAASGAISEQNQEIENYIRYTDYTPYEGLPGM